MRKQLLAGLLAVAVVGTAVGTAAATFLDFGVFRDRALGRGSWLLYGVRGSISASSTGSATPDEAAADARSLALFAKGLKVRVVTQGAAAPNLDMLALWPDAMHPTTLIACNEQDVGDPGLQAIDLMTGAVTTLLTGTTARDPAHVTPWGTILFGEEAGGGPTRGQMLELIDPLGVDGVTFDRATGTFIGGVGADHFAVRGALGRNSFEGIALLPNGVVDYGDEHRPISGTPRGTDFKIDDDFPARSERGPASGAGNVTARGRGGVRTALGPEERSDRLWARHELRLEAGERSRHAQSSISDRQHPIWISRGTTDRRTSHWTRRSSRRERPLVRQQHRQRGDRSLRGEAVRRQRRHGGRGRTNGAVPEMSLFVAGNTELAMLDNIAYQPGSGNWVINEDGDGPAAFGRNNDLWDCLPDGADDEMSAKALRRSTRNAS